MNTRSKIICTSFFWVNFLFFSQSAIAKVQLDSIGFERVGEKIFILHKVVYGETLFSLSRKYDVPMEQIKSSNEILKQGLKSGQTIRIPKGQSTLSSFSSSMHKVSSGETLFSISKKYNVSIESLREWNGLSGNSLKVGQQLLVKRPDSSQSILTESSSPQKDLKQQETLVADNQGQEAFSSAHIERSWDEVTENENAQPINSPNSLETMTFTVDSREWVTHTVKTGETLFSLSKHYGSNLEDLINWNSLSSNNLKSGQILKVKNLSENQPISGLKQSIHQVDPIRQSPMETKRDNSSGVFKNIRESGLAQVIEGTGDHKKYLVLHRTAPVGSVIRVKNEENNITIFARVVGTLSDTGDNAKLVIMLSQAAYDQLKAVNSRFPVEVLY